MAVGCLYLAGLFTLHAGIVMEPYLQGVTSSNVWVMVECDSDDKAVVVEYGETAEYGARARSVYEVATNGKTYVHRVLLRGLKPSTRYHYRVSHDGEVTKDTSFLSAALPGTPFTFAFTSDFQSTAQVQDHLVVLLLNHKPDFLLYGGDMAGNGEKYHMWKEHFFNKQSRLISQIPFFGCVGNHDRWTKNTWAFLQGPYPLDPQAEFYSFEYGDAHFLILNTQVNTTMSYAQAKFARQSLAANRLPWSIVAFHKSAFCAGGHEEDRDMVIMTREIFEPAGVDIVLTGHNHFYQHNLVNGVHHFVMGPAGARLRPPHLAEYTQKAVKGYNFGLFTVTPESLKLTVYGAENKVLDTLELQKPAAAKAALLDERRLSPLLLKL